MQIEPINLRARIERVRLRFDTRVAETLLGRPDLSQAEIGKQFGISQNVIRRVIKQFKISARKRGPKSGPRSGPKPGPKPGHLVLKFENAVAARTQTRHQADADLAALN
jgi:hypothetical protein